MRSAVVLIGLSLVAAACGGLKDPGATLDASTPPLDGPIVVVDPGSPGVDASIDVPIETSAEPSIDARMDSVISAEAEAGARTPCQELIEHLQSQLYYASCLPKALPVPVAFVVAQVVAFQYLVDPKMDWAITPLKREATTIADTSGPTISLGREPLAPDCTFAFRTPSLTIPADANSLNRDLVVNDVVFRGKLLGTLQSCAEIDGTVPLINLSMQDDGDACVLVAMKGPSPLPIVDPSDYVCPASSLPPR